MKAHIYALPIAPTRRLKESEIKYIGFRGINHARIKEIATRTVSNGSTHSLVARKSVGAAAAAAGRSVERNTDGVASNYMRRALDFAQDDLRKCPMLWIMRQLKFFSKHKMPKYFRCTLWNVKNFLPSFTRTVYSFRNRSQLLSAIVGNVWQNVTHRLRKK